MGHSRVKERGTRYKKRKAILGEKKKKKKKHASTLGTDLAFADTSPVKGSSAMETLGGGPSVYYV